MNNIQKINGYTVKEAKAVFFDADALKEPSYKLFRLDGGDTRFYYHINEVNNVVTYFLSATAFVGKTLAGDNSHLIQWAVNLAKEDKSHHYERDSSACYGTLMHIEAEKLLINREYDLDSVYDTVDAYTLEKGYRENIGAWCKRLQKNMVSLMAFVQKHNVKPLAIEVMLASERMKVAGALDLLCEMDIFETVEEDSGEVYKSGKRKGEPKMVKVEKATRVKAIIDFKSGKYFYEGHEVQLAVYRELVKENFGIEVNKLFNWSPKEWKSKAGFNLEDQTDKKSIQKLPHLLELMRIDYPNIAPSRPLDFGGVITMDSDVDEHFNRETLDEMLVRIAEENKPKENEQSILDL